MNYTEQELRTDLKLEQIEKTKIYYSLVKKDGKTISFITNERLLIYDDSRRILYYVNDFKNTPFKSKVPPPKNEVSMPLDTCTFSNPQSTNSLQVRLTGPNSKGELQTVEWIFTFETKKLLYEWLDLLKNEKNRMMEDKTGEKGAGFIHDTLLEAVNMKQEENIRQTILKPEEEVVNIMIPPKEQNDVRNSRMGDPRRSNVHNTTNMGTATDKEREQDLLYSHAYNMHVKPEPSPNNSNIHNTSNSNIRNTNSNIKPMSNSNIRPSPANQSRLTNTRQNEPNNVSNSNIRDPSLYNTRSRQNQQSNNSNNDWNLRFLQEPTEKTIFEFEKIAIETLKTVWSKDTSAIEDNNRVYDVQGIRIIVANCFTKEAVFLKRQFRNYHFILEACKNKVIVGVPLCTLIEWQGIVALVKAPLPAQAVEVRLSKVMLEVRQLERYTRVSNNILEKANLWDLTEVYGPNGQHRMIYVDGLFHYLPIHLEEQMLGSSLRPEFLLDTVNQIIPGGDTKTASRQQQKQLSAASSALPACLKDLSDFLNAQEVLWVDSLELKQIFHSYGVNFKLLPRVYDSVSSKQVRRHIQSVMAAKVAKDQVYDSLLQARRDESRINSEQMIEAYLKLLMEGNNTSSSEAWKELTLRFKRQYNQPITNSQLIPGFFLNSLIKLLRVEVDMTKFNRTKKIFKEEDVVNVGFVLKINPKVKSYYRHSTEFVEKIRYASREEKKSRQIYEQIIDQLELTSRPLSEEYQLNNNYQPFYEYLSYYSCPPEFDQNSIIKNVPVYEQLLKEPPTSFSLKITKSYIQWAIKKDKIDEFKKSIEEALKISDFWLEDGHIYQTDLLQLLSDFYSAQGNYEESINFMKEALSKTLRSCGVQSKRAGNKYYELGERQLKAGRKKEALQSFSKAKANMLANKNNTIKYPLLLMRLASLHLNSGDIQGCIEGALDSIKQFEQFDKSSGAPSLTQGYKIKTYEVLARSYEISLKRNQLKQMALICARKFNRAQMEWTYEQMIRICLAAAIFYHSQERCQIFVGLCAKLQKDEGALESSAAMKDLMKLSQSFVVMQKFLFRFENLERLAGESSSKKGMSQDSRDFLMIARRVSAIVGDDYIEGLVQQKQYE